MKKQIFLAAALIVGGGAHAQIEQDSLRTIEQIQITANRVGERTPVAYTDLSRDDISRVVATGADIPFMLTMTPSVVATSDAGTGTGYTSLSIRGTDGTRINVTANGIPLGDAESHKLYWVNVPDFAASAGDIQIQRGVGTSTNGAGAFGASVNIATEPLSLKPFAEISGTYGSWNTHRESVRFGTGLIKGQWAFSGRLSNIGSDGYVERASADLKSYFVQGGWFGRTTKIKLLSFGGHEATYHAWNGLTNKQIKQLGRRYNTAGEIYDSSWNVVDFYKDQKDFYTQYNVQLIVDQRLSRRWNLNVTGHYTRGDGYYEEYKADRTLAEYGLTGVNTNLVRRKKMWNDFGGALVSANYGARNIELTLGAAWNVYSGDHFGRVVWVENYTGPLKPDHEYYRNTTTKHDANIFAKALWQVAKGVSLWGDVQYRMISHKIDGTNDVYDWRTGVEAMQNLAVNKMYHFFNPKLGVYWNVTDNHALYFSTAVAHKEPTRDDFTNKLGSAPKAERLIDVELGYKLNYEKVTAGVNFYYMHYRDQLVLTGEMNDIGEALATNVPKSFRTGVELTVGWQATKWFRWDVFGTYSHSRLGDKDIAYSPRVVAGNIFSFNVKGFYGALQTQVVGRQYLTNVGKLALPAYTTTTLRASYRFEKVVELGVTINNLFNAKYSSYGYDYSGDGSEAAYFPQATIGALGTITLRF